VDVSQLSLKLFAEKSDAFDPARLIPIFHRYIREGFLKHRLPIDVADYRHVVSGPGVLIVGDACHFGVDFEGGTGLLYSRKRDEVGPFRAKLAEAFADTITIASRLESESGLGFKVNPGQLEIRVVSRLHVKNDKPTFAAAAPELTAFLTELYESPPELTHLDNGKEPFGIRVRMTNPPALAQLASKVSAPV
jgi:hypothetical protein